MRARPSIARLTAVAIVSCLVAGLLSSCTWWQITLGGIGGATAASLSRVNRFYAGPHHLQAMRRIGDTPSDVRLAFIECDDHGWLFNADQARSVIDTVQSLTQRGNVSVVLYIHGWRHNASRGDKDVQAFECTMSYLGDRLQRDDFQALRIRRTGDPSTTVVGIFVGWRGKLAPELPPPLGWMNVPVYASFWNRKAAAHVVGRGDLREFLLHLDDLFDDVNQRSWQASASGSREIRPRMSLVTIGHSFGGQVLFDATRDRIEGHLFKALVSSGADSSALTLSRRLYPARSKTETVHCLELVRGFGDLVILINPATEAASYRRLDDMVRAAHFDSTQTPVLLTVSAEDDGTRGRLFATARGISMFGVRRSRDQARLLGHALGSYGPQVTHELTLRDKDAGTRQRARQRVLAVSGCASPEKFDPRPVAFAGAKPISVEQTRKGFELEDELVRLTPLEPRFVNKPAYVILASPDVISGHSDFFRVGFVSWLSREVLDIQLRNLRREPETLLQAK